MRGDVIMWAFGGVCVWWVLVAGLCSYLFFFLPAETTVQLQWLKTQLNSSYVCQKHLGIKRQCQFQILYVLFKPVFDLKNLVSELSANQSWMSSPVCFSFVWFQVKEAPEYHIKNLSIISASPSMDWDDFRCFWKIRANQSISSIEKQKYNTVGRHPLALPDIATF